MSVISRLLVTCAALFAPQICTTAVAEEGDPVRLNLFGDTRLRYEFADQDALPLDANGLTLGTRIGLEAQLFSRFSALIEGEGVFAIADDFNDSTGDEPLRPVIADPNSLEVNRAQLQARFGKQTSITLGRQRLVIDDQRFIGAADFRQNNQTFDGVHFSTRIKQGSTFQAGYFNRVNRPTGADNVSGRLRGDSYYFNANIQTPIGRIGAFHYALDVGFGTEEVPHEVLSSRTSGFRIDGRWHRGEFGIDWEASYARQKEFAENPIDYNADYWLAGARAFAGPVRLGFRAESLGGGDGQSFQTPAGTVHRFQGDADIFLVTPVDGVVDLEASAIWVIGNKGPFSGITASARHHWFDAERGGADFGTEIDLAISASYRGLGLSLIFADYDADTFASDTQRVFVSLSKRF